jgi:hypothetical protein
VRLASFGFLGAMLYLTGTLAVFVFAIVTLRQGRVFSSKVLLEYQRAAYMGGLRAIWQTEPGCAQFDAELLYKPVEGSCHFKNPEFDLVMHFDAQGRVSPHPQGGMGIAVLGDSYAMGWGVADDKTYAAVMERDLGRPVYNLGVGSYGTYRELLRLEKSGLLPEVDTVVIQYCENDITENLEKLKGDVPSRPEQFEALGRSIQPGAASTLKLWAMDALKLPLKLLLAPLRKPHKDFAPHYAALQAVFQRFSWLKDKHVLVFYSNPWGLKFSNYAEVVAASPAGAPRFLDLQWGPEDYFLVDDHWTESGHRKVASLLEAEMER